MTEKAPEAFRTISEVAEELDLPQHVLRFWETRFSQIRPMKRGGGRRYYRPEDVDLLRGIRQILYGDGYTIKGAQRILKERGVRHVAAIGRGEDPDASREPRLAPPQAKPAASADPFAEYAPKRAREQLARQEPEPEPEPAYDAEDEDDDPPFDPDEAEAPEDVTAAPSREEPAAGPALGGDAVRALRSALGELQDCRRILRELREGSAS